MFPELSTESTLLEATKWGGGIKAVVTVDPNCSGLNVLRETMGLADIFRPDTCGKTIDGVVRTGF